MTQPKDGEGAEALLPSPSITLLLNGEAIPVTRLFDADGDEVGTWDEAFTFVAGPLPDGKWLSALTSDHRKALLA